MTNLNSIISFGGSFTSYSGASISSRPIDFNGDGYDDIVIGAPNFSYSSLGTGGVYIVWGSKIPSFSHIQSLDILSQKDLFIIHSTKSGDTLGASVQGVGDFNGDGYDDLLIGASGYTKFNMSEAGAAFLLYGGPHWFQMSSFNVDSINSSTGIRFWGSADNEHTGSSVSSAGDFNGDGLTDIIISASMANVGPVNETGRVYVVFGNTSFPSSYNLSSLSYSNPNNSLGFSIRGTQHLSHFGDISTFGDFNGDGLSDIFIGTKYSDPFGISNAGEVTIVWGRNSSLSLLTNTSIEDYRVLGNSIGMSIVGETIDHSIGYSLSACDIDNDTYTDIIISTPFPGSTYSTGQVYIIWGSDNLTLFDLPNPLPIHNISQVINNQFLRQGAMFQGESELNYFGFSVSTAGDVNGDGYLDFLVGANQFTSTTEAYGSQPQAGATYLILGHPRSLFNSSLFEYPVLSSALSDISSPPFNVPTGVRLTGKTEYSYLGSVVGTSGNFHATRNTNGKYFSSVIIASPYARTILPSTGVTSVVSICPTTCFQEICSMNPSYIPPVANSGCPVCSPGQYGEFGECQDCPTFSFTSEHESTSCTPCFTATHEGFTTCPSLLDDLEFLESVVLAILAICVIGIAGFTHIYKKQQQPPEYVPIPVQHEGPMIFPFSSDLVMEDPEDDQEDTDPDVN